MERGQNIKEFVKEGEKFIPTDLEHRAHILDGDSKDCPFNRLFFRNYIPFKTDIAHKIVEKTSYDYCWNSCDITDCPAYEANRK